MKVDYFEYSDNNRNKCMFNSKQQNIPMNLIFRVFD